MKKVDFILELIENSERELGTNDLEKIIGYSQDIIDEKITRSSREYAKKVQDIIKSIIDQPSFVPTPPGGDRSK